MSLYGHVCSSYMGNVWNPCSPCDFYVSLPSLSSHSCIYSFFLLAFFQMCAGKCGQGPAALARSQTWCGLGDTPHKKGWWKRHYPQGKPGHSYVFECMYLKLYYWPSIITRTHTYTHIHIHTHIYIYTNAPSLPLAIFLPHFYLPIAHSLPLSHFSCLPPTHLFPMDVCTQKHIYIFFLFADRLTGSCPFRAPSEITHLSEPSSLQASKWSARSPMLRYARDASCKARRRVAMWML